MRGFLVDVSIEIGDWLAGVGVLVRLGLGFPGQLMDSVLIAICPLLFVTYPRPVKILQPWPGQIMSGEPVLDHTRDDPINKS